VTDLGAAWDRFWFAPESARNLAAARIIFSTHALWILLSRDVPAASGFPLVFWAQTNQFNRLRYLLFPGHLLLERILLGLLIVSLCAVLVGYRSRWFALIAGVLLYHLAPLQTIFWTPSPYERGFTIDTLVLVTLSFSHCDAIWSVRRPETVGSLIPGWPLRLIQLFVAEVYLFSGYSKLFRVGWHWIDAENLRRWLLVFNEQDQIAVFHWPGLMLAAHPYICFTIALTAVAFDLSFILVLFWKRSRIVLVPMAALFHLGILFSMNIAFLNIFHLLTFVNWDWAAQKLSFRRSQKARIAHAN